MNITITGMKVGNYSVEVPHGLSELVNRAGAWSTGGAEKELMKEYHREVKRIDGKLVTVLTHLGDKEESA